MSGPEVRRGSETREAVYTPDKVTAIDIIYNPTYMYRL